MARAAVVGFAVFFSWPGGVLAEAHHRTVAVEVEGCEEPLEAEVHRIVGVELRTTVADAVRSGEGATRVAVTCRGLEVDLSLADAATGKRLEHTVALAKAVPTAHARLVALAIAELVVASWQEIQPGPEPNAKGRPPEEPMPEARTAAKDARVERVFAMAEAIGVARALPSSDLWLLGAGACGLVTLSHPITLRFELSGEWGRTSRATGQVAARAMGGALGVGWGVQRRWAFIMPWLGARAGMARLTGKPDLGDRSTSGETQSGPYLGPEIGVAATLFPYATVHATVALSAGALLLGVRGEVAGDSSVNALGPWVGMVVGVGFAKSRVQAP